jgi:hypothetical protein
MELYPFEEAQRQLRNGFSKNGFTEEEASHAVRYEENGLYKIRIDAMEPEAAKRLVAFLPSRHLMDKPVRVRPVGLTGTVGIDGRKATQTFQIGDVPTTVSGDARART